MLVFPLVYKPNRSTSNDAILMKLLLNSQLCIFHTNEYKAIFLPRNFIEILFQLIIIISTQGPKPNIYQ
ncbi:hypothetical protein V1477_002811 [Vespula maculifrons]|uniref:Uncharacterized protein n=1 Tax=Vespula maculifrons TaxID=7453 RepID=A0ABD2CUT5_VESMC